MKKAIFGVIALALSTTAMAYPTKSEWGQETFDKYELYDSSAQDFSVEVDYGISKSCGPSFMYNFAKIDSETAIVTKKPLPRRAFCPPPEHQPILEHGLKFEVPAENGRAHLFLMVPKGAKVKVFGGNYNKILPAGMSQLNLDVQPTFGSQPGFQIYLSGALDSPNYQVKFSKPQIDTDAKTVIIEAKVELPVRAPDTNTPKLFAQMMPIDTYVEGTWTVVIVDGKGNSLRKEQVEVFSVYHGGH